jgi:two-component system, NtrC family, nitrogen regulation sensor histidine kinase NtrY
MGYSPSAGDNAFVATPQSKIQSVPRRKRMRFERRVTLFSSLVALPGLLVSCIFIWVQDWTWQSKLGLSFLVVLVCWALASALQEQVIRPLQTLSNVIAALREEDYSFRMRGAVPDDALGELSLEVNDLTDLLAEQCTRAIEATTLLRRVVEEIDVPVFAFDPNQILKLVNSAGERLLQQPSARLLGSTAKKIGLSECLSTESETIITLSPSHPNVRWLLRRSSFRQNGVPHSLVVLSDVGRALREQERTAWQRLVRVLGHELNNSLTPIKSIAGALNAQVTNNPLTDSQQRDFSKGLEIIEARADSLNRFLQAYQRLAQMPPPSLRKVEFAPIIARVAGLETRVSVKVDRGPDVLLTVDPDQLEQMLINLVRNAVEASLEARTARNHDEVNVRPEVVVRWRLEEDNIVINVEDNGTGLLNPSNAFVPFYTTKPGGNGIGLALCRQIAEAHDGSVELSNRTDKSGCVVKVILPRAQ